MSKSYYYKLFHWKFSQFVERVLRIYGKMTYAWREADNLHDEGGHLVSIHGGAEKPIWWSRGLLDV